MRRAVQNSGGLRPWSVLIMDKMTARKRARRVARSVKGLLRAPKANVTIQGHPELYYKQMWLARPHYESIEFLAKTNGTSIKQTVHEMLGLGIGHYLAAGIREQDRRLSGRPSYLDVVLEHWAKHKRPKR